MHAALRPYITAGVAIVGASALIASPLSASNDLRTRHSADAVALTTTMLTLPVLPILKSTPKTVATTGPSTVAQLISPQPAAPTSASPDPSPHDIIKILAKLYTALGTASASVIAFLTGFPAIVEGVALADYLAADAIERAGYDSYLVHSLAALPTAADPHVNSLLAVATTPIIDALASSLPPPLGTSTTDPADIGLIKSDAYAFGSLVNQYLLDTFGAPVNPFTTAIPASHTAPVASAAPNIALPMETNNVLPAPTTRTREGTVINTTTVKGIDRRTTTNTDSNALPFRPGIAQPKSLRDQLRTQKQRYQTEIAELKTQNKTLEQASPPPTANSTASATQHHQTRQRR